MKSSLMKLNHVSTFSEEGQIEIIRPHRYMKIKCKLFWRSKNRRFIAEIVSIGAPIFITSAAFNWAK
jgi:hypothetical protein